MSKVLKYNLKSAKKYGWNPDWFDADKFDDDLVESIKDFQRECKIKADGMVGPATLRRKETEIMSEDFNPTKRRKRRGEKFIVYNGKKFPIAWEKVILWDEYGGLKAKEGCYYDWSKRPPRAPMQFVNHWDATLSSEACARIINKRGLSMHFLIDNDGTIYQMLDIQHVAWQAGAKSWNNAGIGVEISNAFYLKYQNWYKKKGFGERPIVISEVNGRPVGPHLDFYPIQLKALAALWAAIHDSVGIEMEICHTKGVDEDCRQLNFNGFINHYNLTANKIDCSSLNMEEVLIEAKKFSQNF
jgi:hypothetical protein